MTGRIAGKVAVITGGASGIGLGIARRFVAEGARVVLGDVNEAGLEMATKELGDASSGLHADVMDEDSVAALCAHAVEQHGQLDIGVNAAGLGAYSPVVDQDTATWDIVMGVNLRGVMLSMKHEARAMVAAANGGSIINLASLNAIQPAEGMGLYCATKAAVDMPSASDWNVGRSSGCSNASNGRPTNARGPRATRSPRAGFARVMRPSRAMIAIPTGLSSKPMRSWCSLSTSASSAA